MRGGRQNKKKKKTSKKEKRGKPKGGGEAEWRMLMIAAREGKTATCERLVRAGVDVNALLVQRSC